MKEVLFCLWAIDFCILFSCILFIFISQFIDGGKTADKSHETKYIWFDFFLIFSFYYLKAVTGRIVEQHNVAFSVFNACNFIYAFIFVKEHILFLKDICFFAVCWNCFPLKLLTAIKEILDYSFNH